MLSLSSPTVQLSNYLLVFSLSLFLLTASTNSQPQINFQIWKPVELYLMLFLSWSNSVTTFNLVSLGCIITIILRINFFFLFIYCGLFVLILVVFVLFLLSLRFGQISPLAFFRWFTATSDRNAESCNRIPSNYCLP